MIITILWGVDLLLLFLHFNFRFWEDDNTDPNNCQANPTWYKIRISTLTIEWAISLVLTLAEVFLFFFMRSAINSGYEELKKQVYLFFGILILQMIIRETISVIIDVKFI